MTSCDSVLTEHPEFMMSKQSEIQKSSLTPVFLDCMWVDLWPLETDKPVDLYTSVLNGVVAGHPGMERCAIMRHGGKTATASIANFDITQRLPGSINIGMADVHVEFAPVENLWQYYWHKDWQPPSPRPGQTMTGNKVCAKRNPGGNYNR